MSEDIQKNSRKFMPIIAASAVVLQLLLFLLHAMIYETIIAAFGIESPVLAVVLGLLSLTFVSAMVLTAVGDNVLIRAYYRLAAIWFSFVAPLCGASVLFLVLEDVFPLWHWTMAPATAGIVSFSLAIVAGLYGIGNSFFIRETKIVVPLENVPEIWQGRRVVFFSDVHLGAVRGTGFSRHIVAKVNALHPALVLIGGDLFDGTKCAADRYVAPFKELRAPQGVYFVTGNHEYIRRSDIFLEAIRNAGITVLDDKKVDLDGIDLIGVDWRDTETGEDLARILSMLVSDPHRPNVLVRHVPDHLDVAERAGIAFQLSGHTHRGQFWPLSIATRYFYHNFDYGLRRFGAMEVYTSSGVGTWMSPFRIGTRSEIVIIEFKTTGSPGPKHSPVPTIPAI
jgi:predicted MPP superfamily phosphohydrolase